MYHISIASHSIMRALIESELKFGPLNSGEFSPKSAMSFEILKQADLSVVIHLSVCF